MNNKEIMEKISELEQQIAELKEAAQKQDEPKAWKPKNGEKYWYITPYTSVIDVVFLNDDADYCVIESNNCFRTRERAEEVAKKIRMLLKLERYHDMFCPDYVPDWSSDNGKYVLVYDEVGKQWDYDMFFISIGAAQVYFDSRETAKKVCDLLNGKDYGNES